MVRKGEQKDIPFVTETEERIFSDPWGREDVAAYLTAPHLRLWVFDVDGKAVGYLLGSVIPPEGEIYRVAVLPEARGQGAGEALCCALLSECALVYLEVRKGNRPARTLYEKIGFSLTGERKNYYKNPTEDACLYRWEGSACE